VQSFTSWVLAVADAPYAAFTAHHASTPEEGFASLYHSLWQIHRFGRTARFDLLCLIADMDLLPITAGSCYLNGATGPLRGAKRLWGRHPVAKLSKLADRLAQDLGLPMAVVEDALCMWQKGLT
jgi:hypothetical protein